MKIAVVGAGPAGLTAAYRLLQAGHTAVVFEANPEVGGRTHTEHFGDGHYLDTGAGWLTSAYHRTIALLEELGERERLRPLRASVPPELLVGGRKYTGAGRPRSADGSALIPEREADRLTGWLRALAEYPDDLSVLTAVDHENAHEYLARISPSAERYIFAPMFEGLFAALSKTSAEFVRSWAAAGRASYYQVEGGMDAPWRSLAATLDVRTSSPVTSIDARGAGVRVVIESGAEDFDGAIVAVPAPLAAAMVDRDLQPPWLADVRFSAQVRVYYARTTDAPASLHVRPLPMELVASVESGGTSGAWGACPPGAEWTLICSNEAESAALLSTDDPAVIRCLVDAATELEPATPPADGSDVLHVVRWRHAVPVMAPGHFTRMAGYQRRPPVVFAGDWTHQACVEGAVRSGEAAALAFPG